MRSYIAHGVHKALPVNDARRFKERTTHVKEWAGLGVAPAGSKYPVTPVRRISPAPLPRWRLPVVRARDDHFRSTLDSGSFSASQRTVETGHNLTFASADQELGDSHPLPHLS